MWLHQSPTPSPLPYPPDPETGRGGSEDLARKQVTAFSWGVATPTVIGCGSQGSSGHALPGWSRKCQHTSSIPDVTLPRALFQLTLLGLAPPLAELSLLPLMPMSGTVTASWAHVVFIPPEAPCHTVPSPLPRAVICHSAGRRTAGAG